MHVCRLHEPNLTNKVGAPVCSRVSHGAPLSAACKAHKLMIISNGNLDELINIFISTIHLNGKGWTAGEQCYLMVQPPLST